MQASLLAAEPNQSKAAMKPATTNAFAIILALAQVVCLVGFYLRAQPMSLYYKDPVKDAQLYNYYIGVSIMMFVGFGYLMTFLRWYGMGAVGLTMLITCLGVQVSMLVEPLMLGNQMDMNLMAVLNGNFAVAAFLISFGALIGKVNPSQIVILVCFESIAYCGNKTLLGKIGVVDIGGTIIIHMFGAYFGLAVSSILGEPADMVKEKSSTVSDLCSLIGTTFLWVYWPSFVGGGLPSGTDQANYALLNTILALLGSTLMAFIMSAVLHKNKMIRPVDIQNATLAGGVSIGAVANLNVTAGGALTIGACAGMLSCFGFNVLQEKLLALGLHDSCGVHNLHGMPSLLGGTVSIFLPLLLKDYSGPAGTPGDSLKQLMCIGCTLGLAGVSGAITGVVMKVFKDKGGDWQAHDDSQYWETADDFGKEC